MDNMRSKERSNLEYCEECHNMNDGLTSFTAFKGDKSMKTCSEVEVSREMSSFQISFRRSSKSISLFNLSMLLILFILNAVQGFNLDINSRIEFSGPNPGSYYGYTVAMHKQETGAQESWLLFGAPKDNSTHLPNSKSPGAIYKCSLIQGGFGGHSCEEVYIDDVEDSESDTAYFNGLSRSFIHGRDNQWLGASLDVQKNQGIVTCASRWYNKRFEAEEYFFMNGLCYEIPLDFNRKNIKKIPALVDGTKQTTTVGNGTKLNYGMGCLGGSVHYTNQGQDLLLGAPGLRTFTGGFIDLRQATQVYMTDYTEQPTEISEMAGYAMTSGQYFGHGQTYFAIGAPRDHLTGKVYLFRADRTSFILEQADLTLNGSEITEIPVNGFYGAALCSVDVNKDGFEDLIVAAPFYSMGDKEETGLVLVYLGTSDMKFQPMTAMLTGSNAYGARFGSAISSLGDINKDTYNDIIIGAPYENDLQGAIYVYNGCKTGIWHEYTQRIPAAAIKPGLMSFGISLSKTNDMNNDGVNDIAVGAYLSDKAFLLFGQLVVNMNVSLETSVTQIDKDNSDMCPSTDFGSVVPCFKVNVCFVYNNRQFSTIDVNISVSLDTYMGEYHRIAWQSSGNNEKLFTKRLFSGEKGCIGNQDVIIKSTADLVTPVRIKASYDVITIASGSGNIKPAINKFDGENPQINILTATKILDFKKDCPNNDCQTDLHLRAEAEYDRSDTHFIIGTPTIAVDVSIAKTGHPSYSSNVFIAFPNTINYQKVTAVFGDTEINCGFVTDAESEKEADDVDSLDYLQRQNIPAILENELLMACSFGNPMSNDTGVRFKMSFVVPESTGISKLEFRLNATTLSTELNPTDNSKTIHVEVRNKVATTFTGVSRPDFITVYNTKITYLVSHIYELRNKGPSPLPASSLLILYPQVQSGGTPRLYLNTTTWSCTPPCRITCAFPDSAHTAPVVYSANIGPTYSIDKTPDQDKVGESRTIKDMKNVDCANGGCSRYECELHDIPPRESAVVTLEYVVTGDILEKTSDGNALRIRSESNVRLRELERLIYDVNEHNTDVDTQLLPISPPPQRLPWWIILVSVLGGILLIVLVVIILWKIGFFRRKKLEEMKQMRYQGEVKKKLLDEEDKDANDVEKAKA